MAKNGEYIRQSTKGFYRGSLDYTKIDYALMELITNAYYANETATPVKQVWIDEFKFNSVPCLSITNDGKEFTEIEHAISTSGCESANTPGNQNGHGIKGASAYFLKKEGEDCGREGAYMMIVTKSRSLNYSVGLLDIEGKYYVGEDKLDDGEKEFMNYLISNFLIKVNEGTVCAVYNMGHSNEFEIDNVCKLINDSFLWGTTTTKFTVSVNEDGHYISKKVEYQDYFYRNDDIWNKKEDKKYVRTLQDYFVKDGKKFPFDAIGLNTTKIHNDFPSEKINAYDRRVDEEKNGESKILEKNGIFACFDDGYCPLRNGQFHLLGGRKGHKFNWIRILFIAHPKDEPGYANAKDWREFFTEWGCVNRAKIQRDEVCGKLARKEKGVSTISPTKNWKNFNDKVVEELKKWASAWSGVDFNDNTEIDLDSWQKIINKILPEFPVIEDKKIQFSGSAKGDDNFVSVEHINDSVYIMFNLYSNWFKKSTIDKRKTTTKEVVGMIKGFVAPFLDCTSIKELDKIAESINNVWCRSI